MFRIHQIPRACIAEPNTMKHAEINNLQILFQNIEVLISYEVSKILQTLEASSLSPVICPEKQFFTLHLMNGNAIFHNWKSCLSPLSF